MVVKKLCMTICMLIAMLIASTDGLSQEYYTLAEIKEQAKNGWHEIYRDKYNREIQVNIEIDVFGKGKTPVIKADIPEFVEYFYNHGSPYDEVIDVARKGGKRTHIYRTYGKEIDLDEAYGENYGNDLTVRDAYTFLDELFRVHGQGYTADDFALNTPASFDVVYSKLISTNGIHAPALYNIVFWQKMHELPIIGRSDACFRNSSTRSYLPELFFQIKNEEKYSFDIRPLREIEMVAEDIPLCSIEQIINSIEKEIKDGYIQSVYSLQFGYVVYSDPNISDWTKSELEDEIFYLVPSWVAQCIFSENPKIWNSDADEEVMKSNENFGEYNPLTVKIINAQTGEMFDYFDTRKKGGGDGAYKDVILWSDIK